MENIVEFVDAIIDRGGATSSLIGNPNKKESDFKIKLFGDMVTQRILISAMVKDFMNDNESDISAWISGGYLHINVD